MKLIFSRLRLCLPWPPPAEGLVSYGGLGARNLVNHSARFNQFGSLDQVSLTDLALLEAGNSNQDLAAIAHVVVNELF